MAAAAAELARSPWMMIDCGMVPMERLMSCAQVCILSNANSVEHRHQSAMICKLIGDASEAEGSDAHAAFAISVSSRPYGSLPGDCLSLLYGFVCAWQLVVTRQVISRDERIPTSRWPL